MSAGSGTAGPRHCSGRSCRGAHGSFGFTLVEVVVATAILLVVVLALISSYSFFYARAVQLRAATIGQNLAQLDMEDIRSKSKSTLSNLVQGQDIGDVNYRGEQPGDPGYGQATIYDVGNVDGTFYIPKITAVLGYPPADWSSISSSIRLPPGVIDLAPAGPSYVDYTMVLMKSVFPGYERRIVITDEPPSPPLADDKTFRIDVSVYWTFAGKTRSYTVSTEK